MVEDVASSRVAFAGLTGAPGEDLVGPGVEACFVAEDDGDEDAGAEPVRVIGCDDEREVDRPYRREPIADRNFEGAGEGDEVVGRELGCVYRRRIVPLSKTSGDQRTGMNEARRLAASSWVQPRSLRA